MKILYTSPEVAPFAKTGGLADVAAALPAALAGMGHEVKVVMPRYRCVADGPWSLKSHGDVVAPLPDGDVSFGLWSCELPENPAQFYFLSNDRLFDRAGLYQTEGMDYPDNLDRFAAFSRAVLEVPAALSWNPDIVHANDWQTGLVMTYLKARAKRSSRRPPPGTLFTIHNLGYAGIFPAAAFARLGLPPDYFTPSTLEFYGQVCLLKAGLISADFLSTVSPTYAREIQTAEFGHGFDGLLRMRTGDLVGIVNGVDYRVWDPAHDSHVAQPFRADDLAGKRACKRALQREYQLRVSSAPLLAMISRLARQKGVDLMLEMLDELMHLDVQLVVLGAGDPVLEQQLRQAAQRYAGKMAVRIAFDDALAHRVEAGADLFLMPSRYEPCGLNQLYSLRYGTIPIAARTGGLADTIVNATPSTLKSGTATGFLFDGASAGTLLNTIRLALSHFTSRSDWQLLMRAAMTEDFSWKRAAADYERLYARATTKVRSGGVADRSVSRRSRLSA